ncbi:MAG TPA: hypothetical protein PK400_02000 [Phycisphaerales bacterium]|nr:hypothetical protein [Phycisphaerales bacterium]HRQ75277.1 hypothetical protein [Phycisphaerales bacterium]
MKRLATLHNPALAAELLYRLEAAGIKADASPNAAPAAIYVGSMEMVVWVLDEDFDAAIPILEAFTQDTRTQKETMRCHGCGYDFTGHGIGRNMPTGTVDGHCPECGIPFRLPAADTSCPHCGEDVPTNFDICWNCQQTIDAQ